MRNAFTTLALLVLAQAAALAQFAPNPAYEYVTARLEQSPATSFIPINDYVGLDSTVTFDAGAGGAFIRTGSAAFTRSGGKVSIVQTQREDDGPRVTRLTAPAADPTTGTLSIPVAITYFDGATPKSVSLANTATFSAGRVTTSSTQLFVRSVIDVVSTDIETYRYDGSGRLVEQVSEGDLNGIRFPEDSARYTYDATGRLASSINYSYETDDNGVASYVPSLDLRYVYLGPGNVRAYVIDAGGDTASYFAYRFRGSVLDSFYARDRDFPAPLLGIWRSDDRRTDDIRRYDYFQLSGLAGETTVVARSVQYYNGATSGLADLPRLSGEIVSANPISGGGVLRYSGADASTTEWQIRDLQGRAVGGARAQRELVFPDLAPGIYFATVTAPGYAALAKMLVVQ